MNRWVLVGAIVTAAILIGMTWKLFLENRIEAGFGSYEEDGRNCEDEVFANLMHPEDLKFVEGREWHKVDGGDLHIGGMLTLLNDVGQPRGYEYSCLIRDGRIIVADVE